MASRWATRTRDAVSGLARPGRATSIFHVWNVKRLRPVELGPFDYEREVYTRSLWIAEGLTDYYGDPAVHRAGLSTRDEYLRELSAAIERCRRRPAGCRSPRSMASFDAWIKHYRPDENSVELGDQLLHERGRHRGLLLDAQIRRRRPVRRAWTT